MLFRSGSSSNNSIQAHRGGGELALHGHNVKTGKGGIREIEFFAQTQQLIWGGRDPDLRVKDTCAAMDALVRPGPRLGEAAEAVADCLQALGTIRP